MSWHSGKRSTVILAGVFLALAAGLWAQTIPERLDAVFSRSTVIANDWSVLVESADGAAEYYARGADLPLIPASNQKMFTTAAAFGLLGVNHEFETRIYHTGTLSAGAISGDIVILSEHDPTWNTSVFGSGNSRRALDHIANRLHGLGVRSVAGSVRGYGAMFYNLGSTNTNHAPANQVARNNEAATAFRDALVARGISVAGTTVSSVYSFTPPTGSTLLLTHQSGDLTYSGRRLTVEVASIAINRPSHNPMADYLLRHIGYQLHPQKQDSYAAGGALALAWFRDVAGLDVTGMAIHDGSGLSYSNRVTARQTLHLTRWMMANYPSWGDTLTVSGVNGTMASRLTDYSGRFLGKTGSLGICIALSGFFNHPVDGRRYYIAMIGNRSSIDQTATRGAVDDAVRVLGSTRIMPISPGLLAVRNDGPGTVRVDWADNALTATGYVLRGSSEGVAFPFVPMFPVPYIIESSAPGLNNQDYTEVGTWQASTAHSTAPGLTAGAGSRFTVRTSGTAQARFAPSGLGTGRYRVDVTCYDFASASAPGTTVRLVDARGTRTATFDLSSDTAGNRWRSVGAVEFVAGAGHYVEFDNSAQLLTGSNDRLNPAAVRFVPLFHRETGLAADARRYYRVAAVGPSGAEGEPSNTYAVLVGDSPRVLVVDGNDRWRTQSENTGRGNHAWAAINAAAIADRPHDAADNDAVIAGLVRLHDYGAVVWALGEESTVDRTFDATEQALVTDYLTSRGGALFFSGAEVGYDLDRDTNFTDPDSLFYRTVLRHRYVADNSGIRVVDSVADELFAGIDGLDFSQSPMQVDWPDVVAPINGSVVALQYRGTTLGAGVAYRGEGGGSVIGLGFPFEAIGDAGQRTALMTRALDFLLPASPTTGSGWVLY
ncbi:MAG: D-alanyl-D-alanine carboxypeptidase [Candidatus Sumerlaeia bacterium]|nr:D-alanyl-D-alanine carboxypeptidase [Candidatus Sumerlaeia bacterium]